MNFYIRTTLRAGIALALSAFAFSDNAFANGRVNGSASYQTDSLTNEVLLRRASSITTKQLLAANLAIEKGGARAKKIGRTMVLQLSKVNEEIRTLAKSKNVALPMSSPNEGQRPDGRVDATPENLKDTTRNKTGGGEAGNTGQSVTAANEAGDVALLKSIDNLKKLSGTAFDEAYLNMIALDRQNALPLLQNASKSSDTAVRKFAAKYLTILKKPVKQLY
ncbi:DUF4142 domain-containing protein [Pedobacter endophyticus]|uniref:DUF4142 domain-containing protein n=1 Tax=Pedobacter endophyticus TaxID=2789740 RepID=A0A7S9L0F9_9SPHI|nr:DUF4142 domain-containing protein [Pedobacter endophyticus]QPH40182.1 DUF4142 domain-containing protein [Pedobacter endophyticus]